MTKVVLNLYVCVCVCAESDLHWERDEQGIVFARLIEIYSEKERERERE